MEGPGALARATEVNMKAASFTGQQHRVTADPATFTHINTAALRVVNLVARHGVTAELAAMLGGLVYGECCA